MRKSRSGNRFATIRVEGAILPVDLLQRVSDGDKSLGGISPGDYHLIENEKLNEATNRAWNRMLGAWAAFSASISKFPDSDPKTSLTRERWLLPLFQELGYGRLTTTRAVEIDNKSFAVSHLWSQVPIHLVGCGVDLDSRTEGIAGAARMTPHGLVQELLNRSDGFLWGFVSNGVKLRVLRDNSSLSRQAFVEFDLEAMMEGEAYSDFVLLWLLCHQSRVEAEKTDDCWLEKWSKSAQEQGTRALDQLRDGVTKAISAFGSGFISHPANRELRDKLRSGALNKQDYYRELLRLVYRLLFIFVAEDRDLLFVPDTDRDTRERYIRYYSTARLRRFAGRMRGSKHPDLYCGLRLVMQKLGSDDGCPELGLPALGSFLFSHAAVADIEECEIANTDLLTAVRSLAYTLDGGVLRPVDYRNLGSEELGSVYESLLELHPELNLDAGVFELRTAAGNERKTTGSYYTPTGLIQCLLDSALDPVLDEAVKKPDPEKALLSLKVCDPACGSGHFLIAAAHRIAKRLAMVRTWDIEPSPDAVRTSIRQVISKCIYGVDINPMSVELCKVALWMEAIDPGKPLSFLDHHVRCGNSLIGATPRLLSEGIPDAGFDPIEGDDKKVCSEYKRRNKKEREGQGSLFDSAGQPWEQLGNLTAAMMNIDSDDDDSISAEHRKQERYERLITSESYQNGKLLADMWCAAFMWKKTDGLPYPITEEIFRRVERTPHWCPGWMTVEIRRLASQYGFFHWHLAFPDVMRVPTEYEEPDNPQTGWIGGFSCVLGNPPWDKVELLEREWFAERRPEITNAPTGAKRKAMILALQHEDPSLHAAYTEAARRIDGERQFIQRSSCYPLCGRGRINTYAIFAERFRTIMSSSGRSGLICPTGIATDDSTKAFLGDLVTTKTLHSFVGFKNERFLFPRPVEHTVTFGLLTMLGRALHSETMQFCWLAYTTDEAKDSRRRILLTSQELNLLNPNTRTCPVFRTSADADLTKSIYARIPILVKEPTGQNPWGVSFRQGLFNMTSDSSLFRTHAELWSADMRVEANRFVDGKHTWLPLYEAKMIHQFDHRAGSYAERGTERGFATLPDVTLEQHAAPDFTVTPFYWLDDEEVAQQLSSAESGTPGSRLWNRSWLIGFRDIARSTDERTTISAILPLVAVGNKIPLLMPKPDSAIQASMLVACLNSLVLDYVARQKVGGASLNFFIVKQFTVLPPEVYDSEERRAFLVSRALELIYTSWDIKAFADDVWSDADEALHDAIERQWEENRAVTGGHGWNPPAWVKIDDSGIKLPPFKWDEDRRATLRAELDAYYAKLYGLNRKQFRYILDPHGLSWKELENILDPWEDPTCSGPHLLPAEPALDFPGETFRVLKEKEAKQYGEFRTRRLVLEAWAWLHAEGMMPQAHSEATISIQARPTVMASAKPLPITDDDQTFPWDGRESFVHRCIPQLIALHGGDDKEFEYYRFAAIVASRPDHMRKLLDLSGNPGSLARFDGLSASIQAFPEDQKIRAEQIRRSLERKGLVAIHEDKVLLPNISKVTPPDDTTKQLLALALEAAEVFHREREKATTGPEKVMSPVIADIDRDARLMLAA